jgi:hypothetical protein
MRKLFLLLFVFGCALLFSLPKSYGQGGRPIPPGVREADAQANKPVEPPLPAKKRALDTAQLQREADELAKLSAAIPDQVALVAKGQLPKELADQLKRIEKLSKHLRGEISN